ncbi:MAG: YlbF family regulator [Oscillospiraceae bacterium]|nr:YlbF family regulator [Oscillospiraceae bacterium]
MTVIELTRELGKALQQDARYTAYYAAREANDADTELQQLISDFNTGRTQLNQEMSKTEKDPEKIAKINEDVRNLYGKIMGNPNMVAYNSAKADMDDLLNQINTIITLCANGEDPATCEAKAHSCSGSCSTCGGCH